MITPNDIPAEWKEALSVIKDVCPDAMIAGGALRDLDNGREVKDIDVFFSSGDPEAYWLRVVKLCVALGVDAPNIDLEGRAEDYGPITPTILGQFVAKRAGKLPINLIGANTNITELRLCERMDFGICRIAWDGSGPIFRHWTYEQDKAAQVFHLDAINPETTESRSVERYNRLVEKYAGWPLKIEDRDVRAARLTSVPPRIPVFADENRVTASARV